MCGDGQLERFGDRRHDVGVLRLVYKGTMDALVRR